MKRLSLVLFFLFIIMNVLYAQTCTVIVNIPNVIEFDKDLLLRMNGCHSQFFDGYMWFATTTYIWIPIFLTLLYIIFKRTDLKTFLFTIVVIALLITMTDQISSEFFKPFFHRWRPTHDPQIMNIVDVVRGYRGGNFGFVSSHAANTFGLSVFIYLITKKKIALWIMLTWACLNCYTRIYLGVHFPLDILCGAILGTTCAFFMYFLYNKVCNNFIKGTSSCSGGTCSISDVRLLFFIFVFNLLIIASCSLIFVKMFQS